MIETDILIIGAGPAGLFTVFEAGLLKMRCHIIDALPQMGGQLSELYPKKPIFDIPGFPSVLAGELIDNLYEQIKQFEPGFTFNETAIHLLKLEENLFEVITDKGTKHRAKAVIIAGGLGSFEPKKPPIENISDFEERGVSYFIKRPEDYTGKHMVIAGGGDSKMKLILCGFHEAAIACQSIYQRLNPNKKFVLKYTTVSGIEGFDGTRKQAEKQVVATID